MVGKLVTQPLLYWEEYALWRMPKPRTRQYVNVLETRMKKARLACFDDLARQIGNKEPSEQEKAVKTSEIIHPSKPEKNYRVIVTSDLYVAPNKYVGKPIEIRGMGCFHAGRRTYRCVAKTDAYARPLHVVAEAIEPSSAREAIENDCGGFRKALSPQCTKTIRLTAQSVARNILS